MFFDKSRKKNNENHSRGRRTTFEIISGTKGYYLNIKVEETRKNDAPTKKQTRNIEMQTGPIPDKSHFYRRGSRRGQVRKVKHVDLARLLIKKRQRRT